MPKVKGPKKPETKIRTAPKLSAMKSFVAALVMLAAPGWAGAQTLKDMIYNPGALKPIDSILKVRVGQPAPDFALPSISSEKIRLSQFRGKKNVVISFVPAAFTPVCSDQWPGYNMARGLFEQHHAILLGVTVDNIPTLYAWTRQMGDLWFPVLSDFWPHGAVAGKFGVLRSDGVSERALFFIDKKGIIRDIQVSDINKRPDLEQLALALDKLDQK
jgi:peroxiredoxin (alkyl hydroperoxide reductase subunit C)